MDNRYGSLHYPSMRKHLPSLLALTLFMLFTSNASAQPRFGIEASVGQSIGVTTYVDNAVYVQDNQPFIADENADSGISLALTFVFTRVEVGLDLRWFSRDSVTVNYAGTENLPEGRIRPDGSVDDAGIQYEAVEPITLNVARGRGSLFVGSLFAGYRFYLYDGESVQFYVPAVGGLVMTHVQEDSLEYEFGLTANTGIGMSVDVSSPVAIFATTRLHGLVTPTYGRQTDASRAATKTGETTFSATMDSFIFASLTLGIQFAIR